MKRILPLLLLDTRNKVLIRKCKAKDAWQHSDFVSFLPSEVAKLDSIVFSTCTGGVGYGEKIQCCAQKHKKSLKLFDLGVDSFPPWVG